MAIKSESNTTINGGDLRLAVSGEASKGIKSGGHVVITGGTLDITTTATPSTRVMTYPRRQA